MIFKTRRIYMGLGNNPPTTTPTTVDFSTVRHTNVSYPHITR